MHYARISRIAVILVSAIAFSACFFKSDDTGSSDDIKLSFFYAGKEGTFLVCLETVFHATSKSSGGGMTRISGHTTYRISNYDIDSGKMISRAVLGDMIDERCMVLGVSEGNIWMYSIDEDLGLHSRDPKTLQVKVTQEDILKKNPSLTGKLLRPKHYELQRYFGWEDSTQSIIVTDLQGNALALNTTTFASHPHTGDIKQQIVENNTQDAFQNNAVLMVPTAMRGSSRMSSHNIEDEYVKTSVQMKGSTRYQLAVNDSVIGGEQDFLNGEILLDADQYARGLSSPALRTGDNAYYILHDEVAGESKHQLISKVTVQGKNLTENWKLTVGGDGPFNRAQSIVRIDTTLLIVERTYHETSSRTMGGKQSFIRFSSGEGQYLFKLYSLVNGTALGTFSVDDKNGMTEYIGSVGGNLWFRSYDPALGLHARDPITLKVKITQSQISSANSDITAWSKSSPSYIGYRCVAQNDKVWLEDRTGYFHELDPSTLKITDSKKRDIRSYSSSSIASRYAYTYTRKGAPGSEEMEPMDLNMSGDARKNIETGWGNEKIVSTDAFIQGKLIVQKSGTFPGAPGSISEEEGSSREHALRNGAMFFTISGASLTDTARALVTAMEFNGTGFAKKWATEASSIFFDPDKAIQISGFEKVFSSGNPEYRYTWAGTTSGKLIVISMLHAECFDAATGKRLWQMEF